MGVLFELTKTHFIFTAIRQRWRIFYWGQHMFEKQHKILHYITLAAVLALALMFCRSARGQVPVTISPVAKQQFPDANGVPLAGGLLYTYSAGTSSPLATYTDSAGNSQNTNPIVLDSGGWTPFGLFLSNNSYKYVLKSADGVTQWTIDGIDPAAILAGNLIITGNWTFTGSTLFSGTVTMTGNVTTKSLNSFRFADQYCSTPGTLDGTCITNAIAALPAAGGTVFINPIGSSNTYNIATSISPSKRVNLECAGVPHVGPGTGGSVVLKQTAALNGPIFSIVIPGTIILGCAFDGSIGAGGDLIQVLANSVSIVHVSVFGGQGNGIRIGEDSGSFNENNWLLDDVRLVSNAGNGLYCHSASRNANVGTANNVVTQSNGIDGVKIDACSVSTFTGLTAEVNVACGLHAVNTLNSGAVGYNVFTAADVNEANGTDLCRDANTHGYQFYGGAITSSQTVEPTDNGDEGLIMTNNFARFGAYNGIKAAKINLIGTAISPAYGPSIQFTAVDVLRYGGALSDDAQSIYVGRAGNLTGTGIGNTASGRDAMADYTTATRDVATGLGAFQHATTGTDDVMLGYHAGQAATTATHATVVGAAASLSAVGTDYEAVIGAGATGNGANTVTLGRTNELVWAPGGITTGTAGSATHAVCWKDTTHIGFCSDVVSVSGTCTCN